MPPPRRPDCGRRQAGGLALVQLEAAGVAGIEVLQLEVLAFGDAERVDVFLDLGEDFFSRHDASSLWGGAV
jgi:hypothetical protein